MSNQAALHPRFSVKTSFEGNIIDVSDNEYATHKARNYPKSNGRCAVKQAQPQVEVQAAPRRAIELGVPQPEDKAYWGGKTVVYQSNKAAGVGTVVNAQINQPKQVRAPAANPNNRQWGQQMGQRQAQIQRTQRQARNGAAIVEQDSNSIVVTVPNDLVEGDSFILEMPQGVWGKGVVRPHELAIEADPNADHEVDSAADQAEQQADQANRQYWKGKTIVARPNRQMMVNAPGCQARANALKQQQNGNTIKATPKKIVRQITPASTVQRVNVAANRKNVKKATTGAGQCPCKAK